MHSQHGFRVLETLFEPGFTHRIASLWTATLPSAFSHEPIKPPHTPEDDHGN